MDWILIILRIVWSKLSPIIREALIKWVSELEKMAAETPNKWDDFLVAVLKLIIGIATQPEKPYASAVMSNLQDIIKEHLSG